MAGYNVATLAKLIEQFERMPGVDEFVEASEEELDDLEVGETCFLDEFIGSFQ